MSAGHPRTPPQPVAGRPAHAPPLGRAGQARPHRCVSCLLPPAVLIVTAQRVAPGPGLPRLGLDAVRLPGQWILVAEPLELSAGTEEEGFALQALGRLSEQGAHRRPSVPG